MERRLHWPVSRSKRPLASDNTTADGSFILPLPAGTTRVLNFKMSGGDVVTRYLLHHRFDLDASVIAGPTFRVATESVIEAVETATRVEQDPSKLLATAAVVDCDEIPIEHAIVTVSSPMVGRRCSMSRDRAVLCPGMGLRRRECDGQGS
jgi:hypothetical protein